MCCRSLRRGCGSKANNSSKTLEDQLEQAKPMFEVLFMSLRILVDLIGHSNVLMFTFVTEMLLLFSYLTTFVLRS
jgi:hypothetical protein